MKFNSLIPELYVSDFEKSLEFYLKIGFKKEYSRNKPKFVFLSFEGSQIMVQEIESQWLTGKLEYPFGRGINLQINTRNLITVELRMKKITPKISFRVEENNYKIKNKKILSKELLLMDPDGYLLRFSQDFKL